MRSSSTRPDRKDRVCRCGGGGYGAAMLRVQTRRPAAVAAAGMLVLAGCGGDGDGGERLSKDEWIEQADAICAQANEDVEALEEPTALDEIAAFTDEASGISREALADLRALRPPEEDQATVDEMLDLVEQQIEIGEQIGEAAADGDQAEVQRLAAEAEPIEAEANEQARAYGLADCGEDSDR
jgi:hypothetical protein